MSEENVCHVTADFHQMSVFRMQHWAGLCFLLKQQFSYPKDKPLLKHIFFTDLQKTSNLTWLHLSWLFDVPFNWNRKLQKYCFILKIKLVFFSVQFSLSCSVPMDVMCSTFRKKTSLVYTPWRTPPCWIWNRPKAKFSKYTVIPSVFSLHTFGIGMDENLNWRAAKQGQTH